MPGARYPIEVVRGIPVVSAPAEIDASDAGWLGAVLLQAACCGHARFVVDMTRTQFCDSAGVGVLVAAHHRARAGAGEMRLVIPADGASVRRIFQLTGLDRVIPHFPGLDQALEQAPAVTPLRPPRPRRRPGPGIRTPAEPPPSQA
jgi:anti-sigma B factor antagonist